MIAGPLDASTYPWRRTRFTDSTAASSLSHPVKGWGTHAIAQRDHRYPIPKGGGAPCTLRGAGQSRVGRGPVDSPAKKTASAGSSSRWPRQGLSWLNQREHFVSTPERSGMSKPVIEGQK